MRFILKSLLFIGIATYLTALSYDAEGKDDSVMAQTSGAMGSLITSFLKETAQTPQKPARVGHTLTQQDLAPAWHGPKRRG